MVYERIWVPDLFGKRSWSHLGAELGRVGEPAELQQYPQGLQAMGECPDYSTLVGTGRFGCGIHRIFFLVYVERRT